jgi:uncharacterized Zn finger protein
MSRWDYQLYEKTAPIPVSDGIRAKSKRGAIGAKWWSKRFIAALERMGNSARLQRGRSYARKGQVISLTIGNGLVESNVQGSRRSPYRVTIRLRAFSDAEWKKIFDQMAEEAIYSAQLLAGEVPAEVEDLIGGTGISLFPKAKSELTTSCSCPDWENPCKHIAAAYYLLAERFDDDPFLIFALRGRTKEEVMAALRAGRKVAPGDDVPAAEVPVAGEKVSAGDFWKGGIAPGEIAFSITRDLTVEGSALRLCGEAPFTIRGKSLTDVLLPVYEAARKRAYEMAVRGEDL